MWGISFGEFQCLPVDDCSEVSCDSGALARGSERMSFYSAIFHQRNFKHMGEIKSYHRKLYSYQLVISAMEMGGKRIVERFIEPRASSLGIWLREVQDAFPGTLFIFLLLDI